jgi:penicillin-binding protein 2
MNLDYRQTKEYQEYFEERTISRRISILVWCVGLVLTAYLLSFWYLQVVEGQRYARMAEENRTRRVEVQAPRGAILDRRGEVLVRNRLSFSIVVDAEKTQDLPRTFRVLSKVLDESPEAVAERYARASARHLRYEPVVLLEDVKLSDVAFVEARRADLPGVSIAIEDKRYYESGASAAHLIGYVGEVSAGELDSARFPEARRGDIVGKVGLERYFDTELRGQRGFREVIVNNVGREVGDLAGGSAPQAGDNVRSSIDLDMQRALDLAFGSRAGAAVFLNPRTGEVLALTSRPGYDPNLFVRRFNRNLWRSLVSDPSHPLHNRATQSAYSPGSTFKTVMTAAGLETGAITDSTTFFCGGKAEFYGRVFSCHEGKGHGNVDLHTALVKSCNIYYYNVGRRLGIQTIAAFARRLGLGRPTGLGLGPEEPGLVPDETWKQRVYKDRWYPSETISVSIGQGPLLVTPLQEAVLAAAMATDGRVITPTLRLSTNDSLPAKEKRGEALSPETLDVIRQALWGVVHEWGTGTKALIAGFDVCGKTGTAQVSVSSVGVKNEELLAPELRDHAWFMGFAPLKQPEVAFAVFVEHGGHGSDAAAPIAKAVLEAYLKHRNGGPPPPPSKEVTLADAGASARLR